MIAAPPRGGRNVLRVAEDMDRYSHRLNIESRIAGIADGSGSANDGGWLALASSLVVTVVLSYFIV